MFDRAVSSLISAAAASAAVVVCVVALGFALYALILPMLGPAGAAAVVALVAALAVGIYALIVTFRAQARERESRAAQSAAQSDIMGLVPLALGEFARDRPILIVIVGALATFLAARHPQMVREVLGVLSAWRGRPD